MGKSQLLLITIMALAVAGCGATGGDGHAYQVETPGNGRFEKVKANMGVVISDGSIQAVIPVQVSEGDLIQVEYFLDGKKVVDLMSVRRISTKETAGGLLCRLHSAPERTVGDTVYVKPCTVLR